MISIAHAKGILKQPGSARAAFLGEYLRPEDLTAALSATPYHGRERIWTPMRTLWTFLVQVLHPGSSCRAAVAEVLAEQAAAGRPVQASADPSAYCQAREHLPLSVCRHLLRIVGQTFQARVGDAYRWYGRRVWVVDGSHCSMPDTPPLQEAFGQPSGQKPGCGFPVAKLVAMFCWASGAVLDVAIGPYRSNELGLWRQLHAGDVILGDRFYCTYAALAHLPRLCCDGVFRLWGARGAKMDFRQGQRLGKDDRLCVWSRSPAPRRTLSVEEWMALPATLTVRVLRFHTQGKGYRSRTILVATTLLDPVPYPREQIAALYGDRWTVELRIREVKTTLEMEILRGKSPDVVRKEILMHFLAYDLLRALMWQAAEQHNRPLHRLSFAGTMQHFEAVAPYLWLFAGTPKAQTLYQLLLSWIAHDVLPHRPGRLEPRALKRRPKPYKLLNRPRNQMRKALVR